MLGEQFWCVIVQQRCDSTDCCLLDSYEANPYGYRVKWHIADPKPYDPLAIELRKTFQCS